MTTTKRPMSIAINTDIPPLMEVELRDRFEEPGLGPVSLTRCSHKFIANILQHQRVMYYPKYQRGIDEKGLDDDAKAIAYTTLYAVHDPRLKIDQKRCNEMAVRWLRNDMTNRELIWNIRRGPKFQDPSYDEETGRLSVFETVTVPDSGHRHRAIYTLVGWKLDPSTIPSSVPVDGKPVSRNEIERLLANYNPSQTSVMVKIFNVSPEGEGKIFYQANNLTKPADPGTGHDVLPDQTPESRFINILVTQSSVLAYNEIERRANKISETSRKATTLSTLVGAMHPMRSQLARLEEQGEAKYNDLMNFMEAFWEEYANLFPEWKAGTSVEERQALRKKSYAMSNVIVHALFGVAWKMWKRMADEVHVNWQENPSWRSTLALLRRPLPVSERKDIPTWEPLSIQNPEWKGRILVESKKRTGKTDTIISNTLHTRRAAEAYLLEVIGFDGWLTEPTNSD